MQDERLPLHFKLIYGLGDHSVNVALVALTMIFPFYLTDVVEMRIGLAGLVPLFGRGIDAISDVLMGRVSDRTTWRAGRRRPYMLIGTLPFALSFAAIWAAPEITDPGLEFAYYVAVYMAISITMTIVAIPYQALMPELTESYDERTSLATFRSVSSLVGTLLVLVAFKPSVDAMGGTPAAWALGGAVMAVWIALPWGPIWWVTYERPGRAIRSGLSARESVALVFQNRSFRRLLALFSFGRIAIDLPLALFLHYFTYVIGRPDHFVPTMFTFLVATVVAMPGWLRFARGRDKASVYALACLGWITTFGGLFVLQPGWPLWLTLAICALAGAGYAAADMMPWSMVADIADEDEIASGERREGVFLGIFTFVRKLSGAVGVALAFAVLDAVGFEANGENPEPVRWALRSMVSIVPITFILLSLIAARGYGLGHDRHQEVLAELERRRADRAA